MTLIDSFQPLLFFSALLHDVYLSRTVRVGQIACGFLTVYNFDSISSFFYPEIEILPQDISWHEKNIERKLEKKRDKQINSEMANGFIQLVAFVMMMAAAVMTICICVFPEWKTNDTQGEVIETIRRSQGLWISCMTMSSGHWQCDQYDQFFLGLPAPLQCARACVCMALALQVSVWFNCNF